MEVYYDGRFKFVDTMALEAHLCRAGSQTGTTWATTRTNTLLLQVLHLLGELNLHHVGWCDLKILERLPGLFGTFNRFVLHKRNVTPAVRVATL